MSPTIGNNGTARKSQQAKTSQNKGSTQHHLFSSEWLYCAIHIPCIYNLYIKHTEPLGKNVQVAYIARYIYLHTLRRLRVVFVVQGGLTPGDTAVHAVRVAPLLQHIAFVKTLLPM